MSYAKDEMLKVRYNKSEDKLEFENRYKTKKWIRFCVQNKFIVMTIVTALIMSVINTILIANFFNLLSVGGF